MNQLDKKLRTQRVLTIFFGFSLMSVVVLGLTAKSPEVLVLKELVIVDDEQRPRIVLSTTGEGDESKACVSHFDVEQRLKLWQGTEGSIMSTTYYDNEEKMRLSQGVAGEREAAWVSFFKEDVALSELSWEFGNEEEYPRLILANGLITGPRRIFMYDKEETLRIALDAVDDGSASIHFLDESAYPRLSLGTNEEEDAGISMYDESFFTRWEAFCEDKAVVMKMSDANDKVRLYNVILEDGSSYTSINDEEEEFDILMGSAYGHVIFDVYDDEEKLEETKAIVDSVIEK